MGRILATLCLVAFVLAACQGGLAQQRGDEGSTRARPSVATIFQTLSLPRGQRTAFTFVLPSLPAGHEAVLALRARLDTPRPGGHTPALRMWLNGVPLEGKRLVNKPLRILARGGAIYSMVAGDRFTTYYSPDFASPDRHPQYGLTGGYKSCEFALCVTDLVRSGKNELVVENAASSNIARSLIAAEARIEFRPAVAAQGKAPAAAPRGVLPVYEPAIGRETDYRCHPGDDARIELTVGGEPFVVESRFSTPKPEWVRGTNAWFRFQRRLAPGPEAVRVYDTFTNLTSQPLGIIQRHEIIPGGRLRQVWLAGRALPGGKSTLQEPSNPTALALTASRGVGLVALGDAFRIHVTSFAAPGAVGLEDHELVLPPNGRYTAEWAIVPVDKADYWRFINAVRRMVDANFTIPGGFAFFRASRLTSPWTDDQTRDFIRFKDALYVCAGLGKYEGQPAHGTAFQRLPIDDYREAFARRRRLVPGVRNLVYFHCFLEVTPEAPRRFADSRTLLPDGRQADYGAPALRLFFPTESNSYGRAVAQNVDIILERIKAEGVYWDEHEKSRVDYHYGQPWDGVSGDIDPKTFAVRRLKSSVTLITEPWRVALARRILAQGSLVGNGAPHTRAMAALKFPCFVETGSISNCTRAQLHSPIALGDHLTERSELDAYGTMLAALDFGCLYHWYSDLNVIPTHHTLTRYMYPITPLEIHNGLVIGRERIITRKSGLFGFGDGSRHEIHAFNEEGREVEQFRAPRVERDGHAYSEIRLPEGWSAAIVRR